MEFPWMQASSPDAANGSRLEMYKRELAQRAGLFYRLGYPPSKAIERLVANAAWDFELGCGGRPKELSDKEITEIVKATYLRRPSR